MLALSIAVLFRAWMLTSLAVAQPLPVAPAAPSVPQFVLPAKPAPAPPDKEWWFRPHKDHTPSGGPTDVAFANYPVSFLGDTAHKVVYLTFDAGYETGHIPAILDTLRERGVPAAFFVTRFYLKSAPENVRRMLDEGHVVANHSATHPQLGLKNDDEIREEILANARFFRELTGREMPALFRPPCGACDERVLRLASELGWRSVFWSMAYADWLPEQKGPQYAIEHVMKYHHPGAIILLHPFESNTQALGEIITRLQAEGYTFGSLLDLH